MIVFSRNFISLLFDPKLGAIHLAQRYATGLTDQVWSAPISCLQTQTEQRCNTPNSYHKFNFLRFCMQHQHPTLLTQAHQQ